MPQIGTIIDNTENFFMEQKWFITEVNWIRKQLGPDSALFMQYLRCMLSLQPQITDNAARKGRDFMNTFTKDSHFYVRPKILSGAEITPDRDADDPDQSYIRGMAVECLGMKKKELLDEFFSDISGKSAYSDITDLYRKIITIIDKKKLDRFNKIFIDWVTWPAIVGVCFQLYVSQYFEDLLEKEEDSGQYVFELLLDKRCKLPGTWSIY